MNKRSMARVRSRGNLHAYYRLGMRLIAEGDVHLIREFLNMEAFTAGPRTFGTIRVREQCEARLASLLGRPPGATLDQIDQELGRRK